MTGFKGTQLKPLQMTPQVRVGEAGAELHEEKTLGKLETS